MTQLFVVLVVTLIAYALTDSLWVVWAAVCVGHITGLLSISTYDSLNKATDYLMADSTLNQGRREDDRRRRKNDRTAKGQLAHILIDGDISMLCLLGGLGLVLWAGFGLFMFAGDLDNYTKMFPFGNGWFWIANYTLCGVAMWYLVAERFPRLASLIVGSWVCVIWSWAALARMTAIATLQTGNATSIVYIIIGLLIIDRSKRR
jgi:hypothetical protein